LRGDIQNKILLLAQNKKFPPPIFGLATPLRAEAASLKSSDNIHLHAGRHYMYCM